MSIKTQAYRYIIKTGGLETEKDYPNTEHDDQCHFNPAQVAAKIKGKTRRYSN